MKRFICGDKKHENGNWMVKDLLKKETMFFKIRDHARDAAWRLNQGFALKSDRLPSRTEKTAPVKGWPVPPPKPTPKPVPAPKPGVKASPTHKVKVDLNIPKGADPKVIRDQVHAILQRYADATMKIFKQQVESVAHGLTRNLPI